MIPVRRILNHPLGFFSPLAGIVVGSVRPDTWGPEHARRGCLFMIPGIEGTIWQLRGMIRGLRDAGIDQAIVPIPWGKRVFRQLHNLCAIGPNRERARSIAARIAAHKAAWPEAPVTLLGYSGGGGMAILTAESLPEGVVLERLILVAAAVSPRYDLSRALFRTRQGIINYYSPRDWAFLGVGTSVFGTIDRRRGSSAGRVGFRDEQGRLVDAPRVVQVAWKKEWAELGHNGGHLGWLSLRWAREVLAAELARSGSVLKSSA